MWLISLPTIRCSEHMTLVFAPECCVTVRPSGRPLLMGVSCRSEEFSFSDPQWVRSSSSFLPEASSPLRLLWICLELLQSAWDSCSFLSEIQPSWDAHWHMVTQTLSFMCVFIEKCVMKILRVLFGPAALASTGNLLKILNLIDLLIRVCILIRSLGDRHAH